MLPPVIRQRIHSLLPLLHQAGPAGEVIAIRLASMLDAPDSGPGANSAEEWRLAADELLRRLPDLQRDVRASVGTLSQLLVAMTIPTSAGDKKDGGLWRMASQVGGSVAGWVVDPSSSGLAHKVANAVLPGLEKLTPWVRQFASAPADDNAAEPRPQPNVPAEHDASVDQKPENDGDDDGVDPWETGTLGRSGGA
jgi:hypothetical protein